MIHPQVLANTIVASINMMSLWWRIQYSETICLNTINFVQLIDSIGREEWHKMERDVEREKMKTEIRRSQINKPK